MVTLLATSSMLICFSPHYVFIIIQPAVYISTCFCMHLFWSCTCFYTIVLHHCLTRFTGTLVCINFCASPSRLGWVDPIFYWIVAYILFFPTHFLMTGISVPDFVYIYMLFQGVRLYTMMPNILCFQNIFLVSFDPLNLCSFYFSSFYFNK